MKRSKVIIVSVILTVLTALTVLAASADGKMPFTDVEKDWYYSSVEYVWEHGIMKGVSDKLFSPHGLTTRAEIVTILSRLSGDNVDGMSASQSFKDVASDEWYTDPVGWGVANKIVNGYEDNTFRPDSPVSRQELAALIARYMTFKNHSFPENPLIGSFKDQNKISDWAVQSCETVRLAGIIGGDEKGNFNPESNATRAEIATMIKRYMENSVDPMIEAFENIYDLTEGEGRQIDVHLFYRDRIADHGTTRSLSEQILPQLGLDTETYEFVFAMTDEMHDTLIEATDASITGGTVSNNRNEE